MLGQNEFKDSKLKKRKKSMRKNKEEVDLNFKEANDLQNEFETLERSIMYGDIEQFSNIIRSSDMKYFLVHNDLDYTLFRECLRLQKINFIK
jgi:hypothetical protein